jgi:O-antigen ligase
MALFEFALIAGLIATTVALLASPYTALALLPGPVVLAALFLLRYPPIALYGIVFLIPFGAFRKLGGVNLPWMLAAFLLAVLAIQLAMSRTLPRQWRSSMWLLLLAYLGVNVISAELSDYPETARYEIFLIIAAYIFILLTMTFLNRDGFRHSLPRVIAWSISIGSLLSIAGYYLGFEVFTETTHGGPRERFIGGAIDPNNQAIMILFALPLIVHLALHAENRRERLIMKGLGLLNVFGLMLTLSRSGFLMCIIMALALVFHYRRLFPPRRLGAVIAGAALVSTVLFAAVPSSFFQRQESLAAWEDRSLLRRTSYLGVAWEAFLDHPILGSGPGTFVNIYGASEVTRLFTSKEARRQRRAHNTYLEILVGSGLVGIALYMSILLKAHNNLRDAEKSFAANGDQTTADLVACYRIGYVVLLVFLLMLSDMYHKYMLLSFALSQLALYFARSSANEAGLSHGPATIALRLETVGRSADTVERKS